MAQYKKRYPFTEEQITQLLSNPYTAKVTPHKLRFTLAFKNFVMKECANPEMSYRDIFQKAGYDTELLGYERMKYYIRTIKQEALSPEGLQEPREGTREQELERRYKEDETKKYTKSSIKDLQKRVSQLEQQVEFLKKLSHLERKT